MNNIELTKSFQVDKLIIEQYKTSEIMGKYAAEFTFEKLDKEIKTKGYANLILATGASQFNFLKALKTNHDIDWEKITVFHLDEYFDISTEHPASFRKYLKERIMDEVKPNEFHQINGDAKDKDAELKRYADLLSNHPIDIACIGIGENGHIAFNDPPVADFNDPQVIIIVELDELCRKQQFGEGWFPTLDDVPKKAFSLTIPTIMKSKAISCVVPDERKSDAVYNTINGPISTECPASILRNHDSCKLFLDNDSAIKLD